jgi:glycosyltransferase involved in cell wall biosynthesis
LATPLSTTEPAPQVLILSYFYAPMINPRAFRWHALASHWAKNGYHVQVVAGWEPGLAENETLDGVNIWRVNHALLRRFLPVNTQSQTNPPSNLPTSQRPTFALRLARWAFNTFYFPDAVFLWQESAFRSALALSEPQILISVAPFFSAHCVGLRLKKRWRTCRWIADYGDPFSPQPIETHNNALLYRSLSRSVEERVLSAASAVTLTTTTTRQLYAQAFPAHSAKLRVIPPLFSGEITDSPPTQPHTPLRLVYVGKLYGQVRRPNALFDLLRAVVARTPQLAWRLHIYGDTSQVTEEIALFANDLPERLVLHGVVSRADAAQALAQADVLVNLGNATAHQLPSKVVDYAATGKPVLNLAQVAGDSSALFFAQHAGARTLLLDGSHNLAELAEQFCQFLQTLPSKLTLAERQAWLAQYQLPAIAEQYEQNW